MLTRLNGNPIPDAMATSYLQFTIEELIFKDVPSIKDNRQVFKARKEK